MKSMKKDWYKKGWTMDIREVDMKEKFDVVINITMRRLKKD